MEVKKRLRDKSNEYYDTLEIGKDMDITNSQANLNTTKQNDRKVNPRTSLYVK